MARSIAFDEHSLFDFARQNVVHLRSRCVHVDLVRSEVEFAVTGDGNENGIVTIGFFHVDRIPGFGEFDALALLQHRGNNHENDQKDKHHVRHRRNVDVGGNFSSTSARPHSHSYFLPPVLLDEVVNQFGRRVRHFDTERFNFIGEPVVCPHCRNRHEQTESGGNERFGNTACDSRQTGGLFRRHTFECVDDTDGGSEQTDERSGCTDRGQTGQAALQFRIDDGFGAFTGAA